MKKIEVKSNIIKEKVLHILFKKEEENHLKNRVDIVDPSEFIQCSFLRLEKGKTFKPHKHIFKKRSYDKQIAQESWVVIKGKVNCIFYDIDDSIIGKYILEEGEASFTLQGGHNYEILEEDTIVYEFKTGPYEGQKNDKTFI